MADGSPGPGSAREPAPYIPSLAENGAAIHCLEPGAALVELAAKNLAEARNVTFETASFEATAPAPV